MLAGRRLADFCAQHMPASFQNVLLERTGSDRERRLWQPTRHPVQIETEPFWQAKIDYLHQNPVRKGLVREATHWRIASASYWASGGKRSMKYGSARLSGKRGGGVRERRGAGDLRSGEAAGSETRAERGGGCSGDATAAALGLAVRVVTVCLPGKLGIDYVRKYTYETRAKPGKESAR
jgi:hypothetical protein